MIDKLIRWSADSNTRLPWEQLFFHESFQTSLAPEAAGEYRNSLEMVRIGPSASNKQPWRIVRKGSDFRFYLQRTKGYAGGIISFDIQRQDIGIAMCHFELTALEDGLSGEWVNENIFIEDMQSPEYIVTWRSKA